MIIKRQSILLTLRLAMLFVTAVAMSIFVLKGFFVVFTILAGLLAIFEIFGILQLFDKQNKKLAYFFEAIRNDDTSLAFPENVKDKSLITLHKSLNDLNRMISEIKKKNATNEKFFRELIEHSSTGLLSFDNEGYIEIINSTAKRYIGVVQLSNILLLKQKKPLIYHTITEIKPGEKKTLKTIAEQELISLSVQSSELCFGERTFKLISLQDIGHELEENEIDSWQKLIRVMTHEIMNSVAPITSLTNTLLRFFKNDGIPKHPDELTETDISNTVEGLSVIEERGKGLMHFVENYRKLTKIPVPVFSPLNVKSWGYGLEMLFKTEFEKRNINFTFSSDKSITSFITDEKLLDQIIINLMSNAVDSVSSLPLRDQTDITSDADSNTYNKNRVIQRKICLTVNVSQSGATLIEIADNGCGIDESLMDKIFVPFFTTKEGGNGIGLSLSRQIVRKLNGKLSVKSEKGYGSRFIVEI